MSTIYRCHQCEVEYGRAQPDCDDPYCGHDYEDVKEKV